MSLPTYVLLRQATETDVTKICCDDATNDDCLTGGSCRNNSISSNNNAMLTNEPATNRSTFRRFADYVDAGFSVATAATTRGAQNAIDIDGYRYLCDSRRGLRSYWRCDQAAKTRCIVRLCVDEVRGAMRWNTQQHNHKDKRVANVIQTIRRHMRERAIAELGTPIRAIFDVEVEHAKNNGEWSTEIAKQFPTYETCRQALVKARCSRRKVKQQQKKQGVLLDPPTTPPPTCFDVHTEQNPVGMPATKSLTLDANSHIPSARLSPGSYTRAHLDLLDVFQLEGLDSCDRAMLSPLYKGSPPSFGGSGVGSPGNFCEFVE